MPDIANTNTPNNPQDKIVIPKHIKTLIVNLRLGNTEILKHQIEASSAITTGNAPP